MEMYQQMEILRQRDELRRSNISDEVKDVALRSLPNFRSIPNQFSNVIFNKQDEALKNFEKADTDREFVDAVITYHLDVFKEVIRMAEEWTDLLEELE